MYKENDLKVFAMGAVTLALFAFLITLLIALFARVAIATALQRALIAGLILGLTGWGVAYYLRLTWMEIKAEESKVQTGEHLNVLAGQEPFVPGQIEPYLGEAIERDPERVADMVRKMGLEGQD